jgi:hypothetical protein
MNNRLSLRLKRLLRRWRARGKYQVVPGEEFGKEIPIDSLIYPLRYDVIVRAEFMSYYFAHRDVYSEDLRTFLAHPAARAYYTSWFSDATRSRPELTFGDAMLQSEFLVRMRRALALCDSLQSSGYDERHPIELRAASVIRHEHDKHVNRIFYAGDGCHRLAHLMLQGATCLNPAQYRVRVYQEFQPRDNTYRLLNRLVRTEAEYCRIMSRYYCDGEQYGDAKDIVEHVERSDSSRLDEVTSVLRVDLSRLAESSDSNVMAEFGGYK